jgi:hypothetical protein
MKLLGFLGFLGILLPWRPAPREPSQRPCSSSLPSCCCVFVVVFYVAGWAAANRVSSIIQAVFVSLVGISSADIGHLALSTVSSSGERK